MTSASPYSNLYLASLFCCIRVVSSPPSWTELLSVLLERYPPHPSVGLSLCGHLADMPSSISFMRGYSSFRAQCALPLSPHQSFTPLVRMLRSIAPCQTFSLDFGSLSKVMFARHRSRLVPNVYASASLLFSVKEWYPLCGLLYNKPVSLFQAFSM